MGRGFKPPLPASNCSVSVSPLSAACCLFPVRSSQFSARFASRHLTGLDREARRCGGPSRSRASLDDRELRARRPARREGLGCIRRILPRLVRSRRGPCAPRSGRLVIVVIIEVVKVVQLVGLVEVVTRAVAGGLVVVLRHECLTSRAQAFPSAGCAAVTTGVTGAQPASA